MKQSVIPSTGSGQALSVAKDLAVLTLAAAMFVACSGDSGTSANEGDETATSSSTSVILSDNSHEESSAASSGSVKTVSSSLIASALRFSQ